MGDGLDDLFGVISGSPNSIGASLGGGGRRCPRLQVGWGLACPASGPGLCRQGWPFPEGMRVS